MDVRHGTLLNTYGMPARGGGYIIMAADVELQGSSFSLEHPLTDHLGDRPPPVLRLPAARGIDAAWVRARIPSVFGFTPGPAEAEKALLDLGFVAVIEDRSVCYPFLCSDHYGKSGLMFSDRGPDEGLKWAIANAFWEALTQEPDDLADFEERVFHPGAGIWLNYGCQSGLVYCDESED